jgi:hypothetical protein
MEYKSNELTKIFFMSLPTGNLLVSVIYHSKPPFISPAFCEKVMSPGEREEQWKRIEEVTVNHHQCKVYKDFENYKRDMIITTQNTPQYDSPSSESLKDLNHES